MRHRLKEKRSTKAKTGQMNSQYWLRTSLHLCCRKEVECRIEGKDKRFCLREGIRGLFASSKQKALSSYSLSYLVSKVNREEG